VAPDAGDENVRAIHALNRKIAEDERVHHVLLPLADGLTLALVR
jgi:predicted O-methyltransferase YrrM